MKISKDDQKRLIGLGIAVLITVVAWFGYRQLEASNVAYDIVDAWYTKPTNGDVDLTPLKKQIEDAMTDAYLSQGEWMDIKSAKALLSVGSERARIEKYKAKWGKTK